MSEEAQPLVDQISCLGIGNAIAQPVGPQQLRNLLITAALPFFFYFLAFWQANELVGAFALIIPLYVSCMKVNIT